jgi:hypothetical protein
MAAEDWAVRDYSYLVTVADRTTATVDKRLAREMSGTRYRSSIHERHFGDATNSDVTVAFKGVHEARDQLAQGPPRRPSGPGPCRYRRVTRRRPPGPDAEPEGTSRRRSSQLRQPGATGCDGPRKPFQASACKCHAKPWRTPEDWPIGGQQHRRQARARRSAPAPPHLSPLF